MVGLPGLSELSEEGAKGDILNRLGSPCTALPLPDWVSFIHEGPVVGHPKLGQQTKRNGDITGSQVGEREHPIIDGSQQSYFVAGDFAVVLENGADDGAGVSEHSTSSESEKERGDRKKSFHTSYWRHCETNCSSVLPELILKWF